ncbi:MAG: lipopolysaccharide assembly protein LapA domain-containing protein [Bacillota bacterium]|nr:lipopolysaccharide assembly protein LapA domain-containing protein [Bacillota bacterium]
MTWAWLVWFVAAVLIALFAGQNTDLVVIRFLGWEWRTSQALVITGAAAAGVLLTAVSALPQRVRAYLRSSDLQGQVRRLQEEKRQLSERVTGAEEEARQLAEKLKKAEEEGRRPSGQGSGIGSGTGDRVTEGSAPPPGAAEPGGGR